MAQENWQKYKLLKLLELLRQETDEQHPLSTRQICSKLGGMGIVTFLCGDCTEVLKQLDTESIDLILTSPPYADQRDYGASNTKIEADGYVEWFRPKAEQIYRVLKTMAVLC